MFNAKTSMIFSNKSLKTYIEYTFYSMASNHGLKNLEPLIVPGSALYRTHRIGTVTKVIGSTGCTYVELDKSIYKSLQSVVETKRQAGNLPFTFVNDNILNCKVRPFIDFDATGNIDKVDGKVFSTLLEKQNNMFKDTKCIIYTASIRPISVADTLLKYNDIVYNVLKEKLTILDDIPIDRSSRIKNKWKNDYIQQIDYNKEQRNKAVVNVTKASVARVTTSKMHSSEYTVSLTNNSRIKDAKIFYYNSGDTHMMSFDTHMMSFVLIYK